MPTRVQQFGSTSRQGLRQFSQRRMANFPRRVHELRRQLAQGRNPGALRQALARSWPAHVSGEAPWAMVQEWLKHSLQQESADKLKVGRHERISANINRFS